MVLGSERLSSLIVQSVVPTVSPQCSALSVISPILKLPKDLRLLYELDGHDGCFARVLDRP